jgi:hypothetical protein
MRTASTGISTVKINGVPRYRVTYPTATGRKREHYVSRKKAESRLKEIKDEQKRFGQSMTAMTSTTRADAAAAERILAGTGITLVEAARSILAEKKREQAGVPIAEAVEAFLQSRSDRSTDYLNTLRPRLEYISNFFAGRSTVLGLNSVLVGSSSIPNEPPTTSHFEDTKSSAKYFRNLPALVRLTRLITGILNRTFLLYHCQTRFVQLKYS